MYTTDLPSPTVPPVVQAPAEFTLNTGIGTGSYRMVRVLFFGVAESHEERVLDDVEVNDVYDWTRVNEHTQGEVDWRAAKRRFWDTWRKTGLCPDPSMYEVMGSPQLARVIRETPPRSGLHHYLLLGHETDIQVIAERWIWQEGQSLSGW
jgi:hypothetical protein